MRFLLLIIFLVCGCNLAHENGAQDAALDAQVDASPIDIGVDAQVCASPAPRCTVDPSCTAAPSARCENGIWRCQSSSECRCPVGLAEQRRNATPCYPTDDLGNCDYARATYNADVVCSGIVVVTCPPGYLHNSGSSTPGVSGVSGPACPNPQRRSSDGGLEQ